MDPLFILPLAYFSYKRSLSGIVLTPVALTISMFWFPALERVDPEVEVPDTTNPSLVLTRTQHPAITSTARNREPFV